MHVLVIGYGNPLRGDDAFGWHVAKKIAIPDCQVLTCHQLTPELAEPLSQAGLAIFIDATVERRAERLKCQMWGEPPACDSAVVPSNVCERPHKPAQTAGSQAWRLTPHHVGIDALLSLARDLYGRSPAAYVISAVGEAFDCGETLSPAVAAVLDSAVNLVAQLIADFRRPLPTLS